MCAHGLPGLAKETFFSPFIEVTLHKFQVCNTLIQHLYILHCTLSTPSNGPHQAGRHKSKYQGMFEPGSQPEPRRAMDPLKGLPFCKEFANVWFLPLIDFSQIPQTTMVDFSNVSQKPLNTGGETLKAQLNLDRTK